MGGTALSQNPQEIDIAPFLQRWRTKALTVLLLIAVVTGLPAYAVVLINSIRYGQWTPLIMIYLACYLATVGLLAWPRLDFPLRAWGFIGLSLVNAAASFGRLGLFGSGRLWLVVLPIIAAIVIGTRGGYITAACGLALYAGFAGLAHLRILGNWLSSPVDPLALGFWIEGGAALLVFIPVVVVLIERYVQLHSQALQEASQANAELERLTGTLRESEKRFSTFMSHLPAAVFIKDQQDRLLFANSYVQKLFGWKDCVGKTTFELLPGDAAEAMVKDDGKALTGGLHILTETIRDAEGAERIFETRKFPIPIGEGRNHLGAVAIDITERKRAEDRLRESEERYRVLVEASSEAMFLRNREGSIVYANPAALNLVRANKPEDLLGRDYLELVHPDDRPESIRRINVSLKEGSIAPRRVHRMIARNGQLIQVESAGLPVLYQDQPHLLGIFRDITEQKMAEEALRASEQEARKSARELEVILRIGQIIGSSLDIDDVYEPFVEEVRKLVDFDRLTINIVNLREGSFALKYVAGPDVPERQRGATILLEGSFNAEVVRRKHPLIVQGSSWDRALVDFPRLIPLYEAGLRSIIMVPLISKDQVIGIMSLMSSKPQAYDDGDMRMAERVGLQVGGAIANAQIYSEWKKTEEELRKSETHNRTLVEAASHAKEGVIMLQDEGEREGVIIFANEAATKITGYTPFEFQGLSWLDIISPRDLQIVKDRYRKRLRGEEIRDLQEISIVRKDGSEIPIEISASATEFRMRPATVGFFRDITERRRAEEALRETEERYRALFDGSPDCVYVHDFNGKFIAANPAALRLIGYEREEIPSLTFSALARPDQLSKAFKTFSELRETGVQKEITEFTLVRKDGSYVDVETIESIIFHEGKPYAVQGVARDITGRKRVEEALRRSEEKFSKIFHASPAAITISDLRDGKFIDVNEGFVKIAGFRRDEVIGRTAIELGIWDRNARDRFVEILKTTGKMRAQEFLFFAKSGSPRTLLTSSEIIEVEGIPWVISVAEDITERKQAEEALRKSEEEARRLLQENAIMARIGRIISSTMDIEEVYERFAAEVRKLVPFDRISINEINLDEGKVVMLYTTGLEVPARKAGAIHPLSGSLSGELVRTQAGFLLQGQAMEEFAKGTSGYLPIYQAGIRSMIAVPLISRDRVIGTFVFGSVQEDHYSESDLKLAERIGNQISGAIANIRLFHDYRKTGENLRESEERYRSLVENAPLGIISVDPEGNIKQVNSRLVSILGSPSAEATQAINLFTFPSLVEAGVSANFRRCAESGNSGVFETFYRSKWGKESYLRYHLNPIRDSGDKIAGVQAVVEDITERKRLEEQLLQAQKMEAIGTLAGGIAHDFNNILAAIMGFAELASLDAEENSKVKYNLQQSIQAAHRAKNLVQQILAFSRQGKQERRPLDIGPIVKEGVKLLRASLPATIEIRQEAERDLGTIEADPTQIHQVLMNLCTNAGHAMEGRGGMLGVYLEKVDVEREGVVVAAGVEPGRYLRLRVSDTGEGMTPEVLKRIYDPYFTTKGLGKGTGLGLAVVHGIVQSYRGAITVVSEPGKGTTFDIYFPRADVAVPLEGEKIEPLPLGGKERVLLVDDEQAIVEIGEKILEHLGYEVIVRTSSLEALELFRSNPDRFDVVITDMTMPNMTGEKLAQEMLKMRPEIPIILCTGFSESMSEEKAKALGVREFVMKPLVMKDLAKAIRRSLEQKKKGTRKKGSGQHSDPR